VVLFAFLLYAGLGSLLSQQLAKKVAPGIVLLALPIAAIVHWMDASRPTIAF